MPSYLVLVASSLLGSRKNNSWSDSAACSAESLQRQAQPALSVSGRGRGKAAATPQPWPMGTACSAAWH